MIGRNIFLFAEFSTPNFRLDSEPEQDFLEMDIGPLELYILWTAAMGTWMGMCRDRAQQSAINNTNNKVSNPWAADKAK